MFVVNLIFLLRDTDSGISSLLGLVFIGIIFLVFHFTGKVIIYAAGEVVRLKNRLKLTSEMMRRYHEYLSGFTYYLKLSTENRKKFLVRLAEFMSSKDFAGAEGMEVTERMKVLISASATQLLFGLEHYCLNYFNIVRIYPGIFYSRLMHVHMKGGTTMGGVIMLSWKDFELGYKDDTDKINLGLHELAHALRIEVLNGDDYGSDFDTAMQSWDEFTAPMLEKVKNGEIPFLRKYGGANTQEFWAVCIEHFFEAPHEFREQLPRVYDYLCRLLRQDPLLLHSNQIPAPAELTPPLLEEQEKKVLLPPSPALTRPSFNTGMLTWACMVIMFPATAGIYGLTRHAVIDTSAIILTLIAFSLTGLVIFFRKWKREEMNMLSYIFQSVVLCGLVGTVLLLIINYETSQPLSSEMYRIINSAPVHDKNDYILELENNAYKNFENIRIVSRMPDTEFIEFRFSSGIFGIKILQGYSFTVSKKITAARCEVKRLR